jgi:hypothetical protein
MKNPVSRELAEQEVNEWLDFKKVSPSKREEKKDDIKNIIDAVENGTLVLDKEKLTFEYSLLFPLNELEKLTLTPRVNAGKIQQAMIGVKSDDLYGMFNVYISVMVNKPKELLKSFDAEDYNLLRRVAGFFM